MSRKFRKSGSNLVFWIVLFSLLLVGVGSFVRFSEQNSVVTRSRSKNIPDTIQEYPITATVTNGSCSGANTIQAGEMETVTIIASPGFILPASITVNGAAFSYDPITGDISLSDPTDDVTITAVCDEIPPVVYSIATSVTNGSYSGATSIQEDATGTVMIAAATGYKLPASVTVTGAAFSYDPSSGSISLSNPTGDVTISAICVELQTYSVSTTVTNGSCSGANTILEGGSATVTITAASGYRLPASVTVSGAAYSYSSGVISLRDPTDNVSITAVCDEIIPETYSITTSVTNGSFSGASTVQEGDTATVTITAAAGYKLPASVTVTGATSSYNLATGAISLSDPTGDVTISAVCVELQTFSISTSVTDGSYSGSTTIREQGTATVTITAANGYKLPASVTVTGAAFSYDSATGSISLSNPSDDVTISVVCVELQTYSISTTVTNGTFSGATTIQEGGSAMVTVSPDSDYLLPLSISVSGADKIYTFSTGNIVLSNPTGNVSITVNCTIKPTLDAPSASLSGNSLLVVDNDGDATSFDIYVDGVYAANVQKASSDLSDLTGTSWVLNSYFYYSSLVNDRIYDIDTNIGSGLKRSVGSSQTMFGKTGYAYVYIGSREIGSTVQSGTTNYPLLVDRRYNGIITITGGTDATNSTVINWFRNNATNAGTVFDLSSLGLSTGTYSITVVAKANNRLDSNESSSVSYTVS